MALDDYIFGNYSYGNVKTYTERQDCIVVRTIDSRADNLGLNPGSTIYCGPVAQPLCASVYSCIK